MKEEFRRQRELTPFRAPVAALAALCKRIEESVPNWTARSDIELSVRGRSLRLDSANELATAAPLPARLEGVKIMILLRKNGGWHDRAYHLDLRQHTALVSATGDDETWCAGVTDLTQSFAKQYRTWYGALPGWGFVLAYMAVIGIVLAVMARTLDGWPALIGLALLMVASVMLGVAHSDFFPASVITTTTEENFLRRHQPELLVIATFIGAVAMVLALVL